LDYTPLEQPEEASGGMCVAPEAGDPPEKPAPSKAPSGSTVTYGDGEIHRDGAGIRVDPNVSRQIPFETAGGDWVVTLNGVEAMVAATDNTADGSDGARLAGNLSLISGSATQSDGSGNEVTFGLGVGVGFDASSGTRDADGDGRTEYCVRAAGGGVVSVTAGFCAEPQAVADTIGEFLSDLASAVRP
jgi:hypothetical protein